MILPPTRKLPDPVGLLKRLSESLAANRFEDIRQCFQTPDDATYLFAMAKNRGGLPKVRVAIIPSPPGWPGHYWAIFHAPQSIEEHHDPVYGLVLSSNRWRLTAEIPEAETGKWRIASESYFATIDPAASRVDVQVRVSLHRGRPVAIPFRLNDNYHLRGKVVEADGKSIPHPQPGQILRAGSLLITWTRSVGTSVAFRYDAVLPRSNEDEITTKDAYVTAWWLPSLGRLPFTLDASVTAPSTWKVRAEGFEGPATGEGALTTRHFRCDLPISYPKIIGGSYKEMASRVDQGEAYKIFQLEPTDQKRADKDLAAMVAAGAFYRKTLLPLPFRGYECYDSDRYYGIESYSHTLLQRNYTHFISHEMGHTYFGGLAPCSYVHDSWNEGVTQYIDSVVLLQDADRSLEAGLKTLRVHTPLSKMPVPWDYSNASYYRGCYVLKMLEAEIGKEQVIAGLRAIASKRIGRDTRWGDLRQYFELVSRRNLGWFWKQWVEGCDFPRLALSWKLHAPKNSSWGVSVRLKQYGTARPFRIKVVLRSTSGGVHEDRLVTLTGRTGSFALTSRNKPERIETIVFPYSLVTEWKPDASSARARAPG